MSLKKVYLLVEPEQIVYLVFAAKRLNYKNDVVIKCKVDRATVYSDKTIYSCKPIKIVTKQKEDIEKFVQTFMFENANINTGLKSGVNRYPVFTTKEECIKWLKSET